MQYLQIIIREASLDGIEDKSNLEENIDAAGVRTAIPKHNSEDSDSLSKYADPGNMNKKKEWIVLSKSLKNYLSTILGQNGSPLRCVIHENPDPNYDEKDDEAYDFEKFSNKCAPLCILICKTDARKLHQMIHVFLKGNYSKTWIKPRKEKLDGQVNLKSLHAHYRGKGKNMF